MDADTYFRELFQITMEQIHLLPSIAQKILERILTILAEETGTENTEGRETER